MCFYKRHTTGVLHFMVRIPLISIEDHPIGWFSILSMGYKKDIFAVFAYEFEPLHK